MNVWKRAILYLKRKRGRTILLLCLLFLMALSVLVGISFKESAEKELERLRMSMASGFIMRANTENEMYKEVTEYENGASSTHYAGPMITDEMVEKILSIDGVEGYTVLDKTQVVWTDLMLRPGMYASMEPDPNPDLNELIPNTEEMLTLECHSTNVYACRNGESHKNFRTGALTISKGRNLETGDHFKAVISDWLAEKNHLSIGDTITLETKEGNFDFTKEPLKTWGEPVEVEILGLFHANFSQKASDSTLESCYVENIIYVDMDTDFQLMENLKGHGRYESVPELYDKYTKVEILVEDPVQMDSIMQQIKSCDDINLENIELTIDSSAYEASAGSYRQIRVFSILLLALGLCGIGIVLYLVLKIWMQGRGHEIGIFRSVGMKKREILGQMLAECFVVSFAALVLAFLLAGPTAGWCAGIAERLTAPREDQEAYMVKVDQYFLPQITKTASDKVLLDSTVSAKTMGFATLFVWGIAGFSVMISFSKMDSIELKNLLRSM